MKPLDDDDDHEFAAARPMLLGLAYRLLGSRADAEDAVQDTWLTWRAAAVAVAPIAAVSFAYDERGAATGIYIMRNPDKLAGLA